MKTQAKYIGLDAAQVEKSRQRYGSNILTPPPGESLWRKFLDNFRDPLIIILIVAGVLSVGISCYEYWYLKEEISVFFEPVGIFMAIILATGLAFLFELRAEREFRVLNKVNDSEPVQVIREGNVTEIPRSEVVVGDIVLLNTGEEIPADGELLETIQLSIDESTLTGEPICHKTADPAQFDPQATFPSNKALRGTKVMEGHGVMRVNAVGDATENGKVFEASQIDDNVKTPLDEQFDRLGKLVAYGSYIVAALIVVGRVIVYFAQTDFEWMSFISYMLQTLMIAVTLVVVSVPEGLPMAVTLSLAFSMRRMLTTNNLVRKLHACETMGATTVICTDKTGTLTRNRMQVSQILFFGNPSDSIIEEGLAVNSTAQLDMTGAEPSVLGNPTEGALLLWLNKRGVNYSELRRQVEVTDELPFSTERKYMATIVSHADGKRILYVKGAPEIIYGMCSDTAGTTRAEIDAQLLQWQNQAMRTLAFAYKELSGSEPGISNGKVDCRGLSFIGMTAISDPVRDDVPAAVKVVTDAGVKVKIVTGDTPGTAKEIARRIGLWDDSVDSERNMTCGPDIAAMSDEELRNRVEDIKIVSRARPMDKKRLVESLQSRDEVVAVTGDGTNDAPALKTAHVGLSMGDGTSVAKEASDITIIDNSFASIGRAVMWGRSLFRNIQRFILFQLTVNVVACLIVLVGAFIGMQSPLTVTQMLWVNLIMDTFAAMALASLPPSVSVMRDKPRRRSDFIINREMWRSIAVTGALMFVALLAILIYFEHSDVVSLLHPGRFDFNSPAKLTGYEQSLFFTIFVFLQFWNMFNARAFHTGGSAFHFKDCEWFVFIISAIFFGQIAIVELGGSFFNVEPLSITDWIVIVAGTSPVLIIGELIGVFKR